MSAAYEGQVPIAVAKQAEADLDSQGAKQSHRVDDTARGAAGASDSSKLRLNPILKTPDPKNILLQPSSPASTNPSSTSSPAPK